MSLFSSTPPRSRSSILHLQSRNSLQAESGLSNVHLAQLRLGTTGDLLGAQGHELLLEIIKLLLEVLLVLAPELLASDLAGRLLNPPVSTSPHVQNYARGRIYHCEELAIWRSLVVCRESRVPSNRPCRKVRSSSRQHEFRARAKSERRAGASALATPKNSGDTSGPNAATPGYPTASSKTGSSSTWGWCCCCLLIKY